LRRDNERRRLVVGIGRGGADAGDERAFTFTKLASPIAAAFDEGDPGEVGLGQQHQGIDAHQLAVLVGIAVAGAGTAGTDAAQHRARITSDNTRFLLGVGERQLVAHACSPFSATMASRRRCGSNGTRWARTPVAWCTAPKIAGAVGTRPGSPTPLAPDGPRGS